MAARTGEVADEGTETRFNETGLMDEWIVGLMSAASVNPKIQLSTNPKIQLIYEPGITK
jgi:hypothetical protein